MQGNMKKRWENVFGIFMIIITMRIIRFQDNVENALKHRKQ